MLPPPPAAPLGFGVITKIEISLVELTADADVGSLLSSLYSAASDGGGEVLGVKLAQSSDVSFVYSGSLSSADLRAVVSAAVCGEPATEGCAVAAPAARRSRTLQSARAFEVRQALAEGDTISPAAELAASVGAIPGAEGVVAESSLEVEMETIFVAGGGGLDEATATADAATGDLRGAATSSLGLPASAATVSDSRM